jgi:hypothetical protein
MWYLISTTIESWGFRHISEVLEAKGIETQYYSDEQLLAYGNEEMFSQAELTESVLSSITPLDKDHKICPELRRLTPDSYSGSDSNFNSSAAPILLQISLDRTTELNEFENNLEALFGSSIEIESDSGGGDGRVVVIKAPGPQYALSTVLSSITDLNEVLFVEERMPIELHNKWALDVVCGNDEDTADEKSNNNKWWSILSTYKDQTKTQSDETAAFSSQLDGTNEIIGVVDTGLDHTSCFFHDENYGDIIFSEAMPEHRKIQYYYDYVDQTDDTETGHGTHVCGSVLGEHNDESSEFAEFNGIVPAARIAFMDIGDSSTGALTVPANIGTGAFLPLYKQGARVFSCSWGTMNTNYYNTDARSVDSFMAKYPDTLVIFSAGNSGAYGAYSVTSPATNLNGMAIGASLNR